MKSLKEALYREINIRNVYIVGMILLIVFMFVASTSYALFTATTEKEGALNIVSGNLYALVKSDSIDSNKQITVNSNESKTINIDLINVNNMEAKFILYYETSANKISIGCTENSDICPVESGIILTENGTENDTTTFNVQITNNGSTPATIKFGANVGFDDDTINLVSGQHQLYEIEPIIVSVAGAQDLIEKSNINKTEINEKEMYEITHENGKKDYRYIGENPNNYIKYNDEMYRIIGVFPTENKDGAYEQRIKIIKDETLENKEWSSDNKNIWTTSTLKEKINNTEFYDLLNDKAKEQIEDAKWYLGNIDENSINAEEAYKSERDTNKNEKTWIGQVGLMYPSDYGYTFSEGIDNVCFTNLNNCESKNLSSNWLYKNTNEWMITSLSNSTNNSFILSKNGTLNNINTNDINTSLRPVVFLKYDSRIISGTGTSENPYIIE